MIGLKGEKIIGAAAELIFLALDWIWLMLGKLKTEKLEGFPGPKGEFPTVGWVGAIGCDPKLGNLVIGAELMMWDPNAVGLAVDWARLLLPEKLNAGKLAAKEELPSIGWVCCIFGSLKSGNLVEGREVMGCPKGPNEPKLFPDEEVSFPSGLGILWFIKRSGTVPSSVCLLSVNGSDDDDVLFFLGGDGSSSLTVTGRSFGSISGNVDDDGNPWLVHERGTINTLFCELLLDEGQDDSIFS